VAKRKMKCRFCSRTFSMPAHLGRHMKAIHGSTIAGKSAGAGSSGGAGRKGHGRKRRGRPRGASRPMADAMMDASPGRSIEQLVAALRGHLDLIAARRESLGVEEEAVRRAIIAMGIAAPASVVARGARASNGRGRRKRPLRDHIERVLRRRSAPMSPSDIATALSGSGYKSKSQNLTKVVSNTLPRMTIVRKAGFGLYTV